MQTFVIELDDIKATFIFLILIVCQQ